MTDQHHPDCDATWRSFFGDDPVPASDCPTCAAHRAVEASAMWDPEDVPVLEHMNAWPGWTKDEHNADAERVAREAKEFIRDFEEQFFYGGASDAPDESGVAVINNRCYAVGEVPPGFLQIMDGGEETLDRVREKLREADE